MEIIVKIIQKLSNDPNHSAWDIHITQGENQIEDESDLIKAIGSTSLPIVKGIIDVHKISPTHWVVRSKK